MTPITRLDAPGVCPTIGDLRRAKDMLLAAGDASATNVAQALALILAGGDAIRALGLKATSGRRSALTVDRIVARDALLRQLAARHYPERSVSAQARAIEADASAYWRRAARLDIDLEDMPASYIGMPREFLFHIVRLPATVPSARTIRLVLAS